MCKDDLEVLKQAILGQKSFVEQWRKPIEPLLFESIRAIDNVFCQQLFFADTLQPEEQFWNSSLLTWGVNQTLDLMMPTEFETGPFKFFQSNTIYQQQADELLRQCGILEKTQLLEGWLSEGLLSSQLNTTSRTMPPEINKILVLKTKHASLYQEEVARKHCDWVSGLTMENDRTWEIDLGKRHEEMLPDLIKCVDLFRDWGIQYISTKEIDDYFLECGQIYLRRMFGQDLIGPTDKIGDYDFNVYLGVLAGLAGRAQKHLCFASILKQRHPNLDLRNMLTTFSGVDEFVIGLASHLDADRLQIEKILTHLTLDPFNKDAHVRTGETVWAPIVRANENAFILPLYGMEINPFLFLLRDLRIKYPKDWFAASNKREGRWIADLELLFPSPRWESNSKNLKLRDNKKIITDLDFAAYDCTNNELALFQLKWQQPVGMDNRARRSAGKNLITEGNKWVETVYAWLDKYGLDELCTRLNISVRPDLTVRVFVVARYNALFSGYSARDSRAVWVDWNHMMKVRFESPTSSVIQLAETLNHEIEKKSSTVKGESYSYPIQDVAVILNPTSEPAHI